MSARPVVDIPYRQPRDFVATRPRDFQRCADGRYIFSVIDDGIRFELAQLRWQHHELWAQLTVECTLAGARVIDGRTLHVADFNLSSASSRVTRAKILAAAARTGNEIDWTALIEELSQRTLRAEAIGDPAVPLADVPLPDADDEHDIDGLRFPKRDLSMVVADGGTGKSRLANFLSGRLAARGERVLIVDYESDGGEWRKRTGAMFDPVPPGLFYLRATAPLINEIDRIRHEIATKAITYVWVDSVVPGCHGKPEDADVATAYTQAARRFGVGSGHLAHIPKSAVRGAERPFGSQFWWNAVRSLWVLESHQLPDRLVIACHHRKSNNSARYPAVGFQFDFDVARTVVSRCNVGDVAELAEALPLWQRMRDEVRGGALTVADLASRLDAKHDSIAIAAKRKSWLFTKVLGIDGIARIGLAERRTL
jgi:hypothetical protein